MAAPLPLSLHNIAVSGYDAPAAATAKKKPRSAMDRRLANIAKINQRNLFQLRAGGAAAEVWEQTVGRWDIALELAARTGGADAVWDAVPPPFEVAPSTPALETNASFGSPVLEANSSAGGATQNPGSRRKPPSALGVSGAPQRVSIAASASSPMLQSNDSPLVRVVEPSNWTCTPEGTRRVASPHPLKGGESPMVRVVAPSNWTCSAEGARRVASPIKEILAEPPQR